MRSPIVMGGPAHAWTIIHDEVDYGPSGAVAFTSREAMDTHPEVLISDEQWRAPVGSFEAHLLSLTPNPRILILNEAWGEKFLDPCPPMHSVEDGRTVLELLMRGPLTKMQGALPHEGLVAELVMGGGGPAEKLVMALRLRHHYEVYRSLSRWRPIGRVDDRGVIRLLDSLDLPSEAVAITKNGRRVKVARRNSSGGLVPQHRMSPGEEVMVLPDVSGDTAPLWGPRPVSRVTPLSVVLT